MLRKIKRETAAIRVQTQALYAEWNKLNRPDRLRRLLAQRNRLAPVDGGQLREFTELPGFLGGENLAGRRTLRVAARPLLRAGSPPGAPQASRQ